MNEMTKWTLKAKRSEITRESEFIGKATLYDPEGTPIKFLNKISAKRREPGAEYDCMNDDGTFNLLIEINNVILELED